MKQYTREESFLAHFLLSDTKSSLFWLVVRVYVGWIWLNAGWEKVINPVWFGTDAGAALKGFIMGALSKTGGPHPDVQGWYAYFLQTFVLNNTTIWSNLVAVGELLIGLALIFGFLTGVSAFFGVFMNLNFMLAGTVSINPTLFVLGLGLVLAWRVSGYLGADAFALPRLHSYLRSKNRN